MKRHLARAQRFGQLAALIRHDTPLEEAVKAMHDAEEDQKLKQGLFATVARLQQGASPADALADAELLPRTLVHSALDGTDEKLADGLDQLASYAQVRAELLSMGRTVMAYPALLVGGTLLLLLFFVFALVPSYASLAPNGGPVTLANHMMDHRLLVLGVPMALASLLVFLHMAMPALSARIWAMAPFLGGLLRKLALSEMLQALALRMRTNPSLSSAYADAAGSVSNPWFRSKLLSVKNTQRVAAPLYRCDIARDYECVLLAAGEKRQDSGERLAEAALRCRARLQADVRRTMVWLAPLSLAIMLTGVSVIMQQSFAPILQVAAMGH